jgi:uncharacterized protein (DUF433 family)
LLLEEASRQRDFPFIEFRASAAGRQAYVKSTRLAVWHVAMIARHFDDPVPQVAAHLELPEFKIAAALSYAAAYAEEVASAIAENEAIAANI